MSAKLLDGKHIAQDYQRKIAMQIKQRTSAGLPQPGLAMILIGKDPASEIYVANKQKACQAVGIHSRVKTLSANIDQAELLTEITECNQDKAVHGVLVQLPLPAHIDTTLIIDAIAVNKDVDGFHPFNIGRLAQARPLFRPATPMGIMTLLNANDIQLAGLHSVVVGASKIVGRPLALELLTAGSTITICHRATRELAHHVQQADLLVSATGKRDLISSEWIKPGAIVIDVGIHRLANGKLCGDIDFTSACERASWITPVPGGVGPMTVTSLLQNTLIAAEMQAS